MSRNAYILGLFVLFVMIIPPPVFAAQVAQLVPANESDCYDFTTNLRFGMGGTKNPSTSAEILRLQSDLSKEGFPILQTQFGIFGLDTFLAVIGFQEKYKEDILIPNKLSGGTGYVGNFTRSKLNFLYGCRQDSPGKTKVDKVVLKVKGVLLDNNGVAVTLCNFSSGDVVTFPVRVRLNGITREFDIRSALEENTCYPARWPYETWGLSYDPEIVYTAVVTIDPFGYYKKGMLFFPDLETLAVPALEGMSLSVRNLLFKHDKLQATFCNMGTTDVPSFSVTTILNEAEKDFDITDAHKSGKCASVSWPFAVWGIPYSSGTTYTAVLIVKGFSWYNGPDNANSTDLDEFNNAAAISGTLQDS